LRSPRTEPIYVLPTPATRACAGILRWRDQRLRGQWNRLCQCDLRRRGPALSASITRPRACCARPDGSLYIADTGREPPGASRADGTISTVAGASTPRARRPCDLRRERSATHAAAVNPQHLTLGPDGSLYVTDGCHPSRLVKSAPTAHRANRRSEQQRADGRLRRRGRQRQNSASFPWGVRGGTGRLGLHQRTSGSTRSCASARTTGCHTRVAGAAGVGTCETRVRRRTPRANALICNPEGSLSTCWARSTSPTGQPSHPLDRTRRHDRTSGGNGRRLWCGGGASNCRQLQKPGGSVDRRTGSSSLPRRTRPHPAGESGAARVQRQRNVYPIVNRANAMRPTFSTQLAPPAHAAALTGAPP
jgi:hypothetical protein